MMLTPTIVKDYPQTSALQPIPASTAHRIASDYIAATVDPTFGLVSGACYFSKPLDCDVWRFIIRCSAGPIGAIYVDAQSGKLIPFTTEDIRLVKERAIIAEAQRRGELPTDEDGYVLSEFARRQADSYLSMDISLFYSATDGVFIPLARPIWQFMIQVRLPELGVLGLLGPLDVDARTGTPIQLTNKQIKRIQERANALVEFRTQTATASI